MPRAGKALVGAHDAHVVPHQAADLVPHVAHEHSLVRRHGAADAPRGNLELRRQTVGTGREAVRGEARGDERLHERVGRQAVRAVQARASRLAHGRKAGQRGAPVHGGQHAAAAVVGGGDDRDEVLRHVDSEGEACLVDVGETLLQKRAPLLADVEAAVRRAGALHLAVDRARHDVARREGAARIVVLHEGPPLAVHQHGPFPAHRLGDEEALGLGMVEAGGMELHELHVRDLRARAPRERHAVARGRVGVAGIEVDLAATARGKDGIGRTDGVDLARARIEHVRAHAAAGAGQAEAARGDQLDHHRLLAHVDRRLPLERADHGRLALLSGDVARVEDAPHGVPALAAEVPRAVLLLREADAAVDQVTDAGGGLAHDTPHHLLVAQSRAGDERVLHVRGERVGGIGHAADAALGEVGVAVLQALLRRQDDAPRRRQVKRRHQAAHARTDNEIVAIKDFHRWD